MAENPENDPRIALAGERTNFAKFRTSLALDRTTLAWILPSCLAALCRNSPQSSLCILHCCRLLSLSCMAFTHFLLWVRSALLPRDRAAELLLKSTD
jgi:hypothetical protein